MNEEWTLRVLLYSRKIFLIKVICLESLHSQKFPDENSVLLKYLAYFYFSYQFMLVMGLPEWHDLETNLVL